MEKKRSRPKRRPAKTKYWIVRCRKCDIIFNLPQAKNRSLNMEIGKAKCPDCGSFLVRSNRTHGIPIRTITREQTNLA